MQQLASSQLLSLHLPLDKKHANIKYTLSINALRCFTTTPNVYLLDTQRMIFRQINPFTNPLGHADGKVGNR